MAQLVTIKHPDIDGEATVALEAVPGHAARGWLVGDRVADPTVATPPATLTRPAANASADVWRTYAVAAHVLGVADGLSFDEAMSMGRDQLVAHFQPLPDLAADGDPATADTLES